MDIVDIVDTVDAETDSGGQVIIKLKVEEVMVVRKGM